MNIADEQTGQAWRCIDFSSRRIPLGGTVGRLTWGKSCVEYADPAFGTVTAGGPIWRGSPEPLSEFFVSLLTNTQDELRLELESDQPEISPTSQRAAARSKVVCPPLIGLRRG